MILDNINELLYKILYITKLQFISIIYVNNLGK